MRALALTTRYRDGAYEADACLLAYDEMTLTGSIVSADVRDVLDRRPNTPWIYVLAPFHSEVDVLEAVLQGTGAQRAGGSISVLAYRRSEGGEISVMCISHDPAGDAQLVEKRLPVELQHGWLFDLFDSRGGRVEAPVGVHFGKASGKHADKFLRTSSVLLSTVACGTAAFFTLASLRVRPVRRIFVDTAPLLSIAFAMHRIAALHRIWGDSPPAQSFSSYGGLDKLPSLGRHDLVLISASTSGGLAMEIVKLGADEELIATLFLLKSKAGMAKAGVVVCDLTFRPDRPFGYPMVDNQPLATCDFCKRGYVLAPLEGDQFLLEKRSLKRLRVSTASQSKDAREVFDLLARKSLLSVEFYKHETRRTNIKIDVGRILADSNEVTEKVIRLLKRFTPVPVTYVVLVEITPVVFESLITAAGLTKVFEGVKVVTGGEVESLEAVDGGNVLVMIGYLWDHATIRGINAQLRTRVPRGCVAYISAFTVADSARNLEDLRMFLSYGEFGRETFVYRSAIDLMFPWLQDLPSAWEDELQLLLRLQSESTLTTLLEERLRRLESASSETDRLFLSGKDGELGIAADFVYLDTSHEREKISQADIYSVVANLLATARCDNKGLAGTAKGETAIQWNQTVYGQVLLAPASLCPRNLRDYNDAILRAAFLRAAHRQELNFAVDEEISAEVLDVLLAELNGWQDGRGDALPEFLTSMACGRLKLMPEHFERFKSAAAAADLPPELVQLLGAAPVE